MFLCNLDVAVRSPGKIAAATVDSLATALARNGQLVGPYVVGRTGEGYRITGVAPLPNALAGSFHSAEAAMIGRRLQDDFGGEIELSIEAHDEPLLHASSLEVASELFLGSVPPSNASAVTTDAGLHLPLFLLPAPLRSRIVAWAGERQLLQRIEGYAGALSRNAGEAISQPGGSHFEEGRALAKAIEEATGLPAYYTLYCPPDLVAELSVCPSCEGELDARVSIEGERLRVCNGCRLAASE